MAKLESVSAGLDAWVQSRADRCALVAAPDSSSRRFFEFSINPNWTTEESNKPSNNGPSTTSASGLAQQDEIKRIFVFAISSKYEGRSRTRTRITLRNAHYMSFKFEETTLLLFTIFSFDNPKGSVWTAYKHGCVQYGLTKAYRQYIPCLLYTSPSPRD